MKLSKLELHSYLTHTHYSIPYHQTVLHCDRPEQCIFLRPDLTDKPHTCGGLWMVHVQRHLQKKTDYADFVSLPNEGIDARSLPSHFSDQAAELVALTRPCILAASMHFPLCVILQNNGTEEAW